MRTKLSMPISRVPTQDLPKFQQVATGSDDRMLFVDSRKDMELGYFSNSRMHRSVVWLRKNLLGKSSSGRQSKDIAGAYDRFIDVVRASHLNRNDAELQRVQGQLADDLSRGKPLTARKVRQALAEIAPDNPQFVLVNRQTINRHANGAAVSRLVKDAAAARPSLAGMKAPHQLLSRSDRARVCDRIAASLDAVGQIAETRIDEATAQATARREVESELARLEARLSGLPRKEKAEFAELTEHLQETDEEMATSMDELSSLRDAPADSEDRKLAISRLALGRRRLALANERLNSLEEKFRSTGPIDAAGQKLLDDLRGNIADLQVDLADFVTDYDIDAVTTPGAANRADTSPAPGDNATEWFAPVGPAGAWELVDYGKILTPGSSEEQRQVDATAFDSYLDKALYGAKLHFDPKQVSPGNARTSMRRMLAPAMPMPEVSSRGALFGQAGNSAFPPTHKVVDDPVKLSSRELRDRLNLLQAKRRCLAETEQLAAQGKPVTEEELQAVQDYIDTSSDVNGVLCAGRASNARIDRKIANLDSVLEKLPDNRVSTYRALRADSAVAEELLAAAGTGNTVLSSKGFISTSVAPEVSKTYWRVRLHGGDSEILYEVRGLRGKNISALPDLAERRFDAAGREYMSEEERLVQPSPNIDNSGSTSGEILFQPGSRFLVTAGARHQNENRYAFVLQEIADDSDLPESARMLDLNRLMPQ